MKPLVFLGLLQSAVVTLSLGQPDSISLSSGRVTGNRDSTMWIPIDVRWQKSIRTADSLTYALLSHPQGSTGPEIVPQLGADSMSLWSLDTLLWFSPDSECGFAAYLLRMNKKDSTIEAIHLLPAGGDSYRGLAHHGHWTRAGDSLFSLVSEQGGMDGVDGPWREFSGTKRHDWLNFLPTDGGIERVVFNGRIYRPEILRLW